MPEWRPYDYSRSRAVLVGASEYDSLQDLPAALNSLNRMYGLLTGPLCGWPADRVDLMVNERGHRNLPDSLITSFEDAADVALFYYVGHGQIDLSNQLCLGLPGSRTEVNRRAATSLPFDAVRRAMLDSPADIKIVILDCCFAGLAGLPANSLAASSDDVIDRTGGSGAYTMMASEAYATAWYDTTPGVVRPQTFFTQYLVDLVESGIPRQPSGLRLHPLFVQLRDLLATDGRPVPVERSVDAARDFVFARNAAPPQTQRDLGPEVSEFVRQVAETAARTALIEATRALYVGEAGERAATAEPPERSRRSARRSARGPGGWGWIDHFRLTFSRNRRARAAAGIVIVAAAVLATVLMLLPGPGTGKNPQASGSPRPSPSLTTSALRVDCVPGVLQLMGSAFGSIAQTVADAYMSQCKEAKITITYKQNKDSAWGVTAVASAVTQHKPQAGTMIAMYDGVTKDGGPLKGHPVGVFIYSVIAHAGTASSGANITSSKLKQLYTQPGGVPGEVAVGLQSGSGTRQALLGMFGEHASDETPAGACPSPSENPVSYRSCSEDSYAKALAFINGTPYSIGYVAVDQDDKEGHPAGGYTDVSVLSIDGYAPTQENVHLGTYKFAAAEHLYVSPQPSPLAKSFLTFLPQYLAQHQNQWLDYLPCSSVPHTSESVKSLYTDCER